MDIRECAVLRLIGMCDTDSLIQTKNDKYRLREIIHGDQERL